MHCQHTYTHTYTPYQPLAVSESLSCSFHRATLEPRTLKTLFSSLNTYTRDCPRTRLCALCSYVYIQMLMRTVCVGPASRDPSTATEELDGKRGAGGGGVGGFCVQGTGWNAKFNRGFAAGSRVVGVRVRCSGKIIECNTPLCPFRFLLFRLSTGRAQQPRTTITLHNI